ncbi:PREDICTED: AAA-ATPase [Prunus dulcis]|uniref:PREDICTED: AAA-ATPase n=1 Tax=Prunus dulcis TaxID=3755 RepID=A0A5E4FJB3_PRUDU|nr:AAA-ATPase At3g50940-like [Prunus dulcis]VVA27250.1 PREDICTED: AAA-ATPase [Prunus dulcis]
MDSFKKIPAACASNVVVYLMLVWSKAMDCYLLPMLRFPLLILHGFFKRWLIKAMTLQIEEYHGTSTRNKVYDASALYLQSKISPSTQILKISQTWRETSLTVNFANNQEFDDMYEGVPLKWKFNSMSKRSSSSSTSSAFKPEQKQHFELVFDLQHKEKVINLYLPYVLETFEAMKNERKIVKLHTLVRIDAFKIRWEAINLEHPATFQTVAMEPELKKTVLEDLDRFVKRKEFYQSVGRAWKRGYLLYGPPGTGKSSLIAAMANYLKFDVYDLQLTHLKTDMELRKVLLSTSNKSILVIEDIDCSQPGVQDRKNANGIRKPELEGNQLTLSGLLNFIDGLWSSCGEERIVVFTTNHKSKLDPALLRSGRMDLHIHMSYCTYEGFKSLAFNYLSTTCEQKHLLFEEIESLLKKTKVTPAQVAEQLMKSEEPEVALQGLITLLKQKKNQGKDEYQEEDEYEGENKQLTYFI